MHYCAKWEVGTLIIYIFLFCFEFMIRVFYAIKKTLDVRTVTQPTYP